MKRILSVDTEAGSFVSTQNMPISPIVAYANQQQNNNNNQHHSWFDSANLTSFASDQQQHEEDTTTTSKTTSGTLQTTERKKYYTRCPCGIHLHVMNGNIDGEEYVPSTLEELANVITHFIPAVLSFVILPSVFKLVANTPREQFSAYIYGGCCTLLFSVSTLYHMSGLIFGKESKVNEFFLKLDMTTIFAFIAASYTPWGLLIDVGADNVYGRSMITFIWLFAVLGTLKNLVGILPNVPSLYVYLGMGWMSAVYIIALVVLTMGNFIEKSPNMWGIAEIFIGGLLYNIGTMVFKMDGKLPFAHAIWHIFVVLAAATHLHAVIVHVMCLE